jgi:hypothetical protein
LLTKSADFPELLSEEENGFALAINEQGQWDLQNYKKMKPIRQIL